MSNLHHRVLSAGAFWSVNKTLGLMFGLEGAVFLQDLIEKDKYFIDRKMDVNDWWFCTEEDRQRSTFLSAYKQRQHIAHFLELGFLKTKRMGVPAKTYFKFDGDYLIELVDDFEQEAYETLQCASSEETTELLGKKFNNYLLKNSITINNNKDKKNKDIKLHSQRKKSDGIKSRISPSKFDKRTNSIFNLMIEVFSLRRKISHTMKPGKWKIEIKKILKNIEYIEVRKSLNWYKKHWNDNKWVPVINSPSAFNKKYDSLLDAIDRSKRKPDKKIKHINFTNDVMVDNRDFTKEVALATTHTNHHIM